MTAAARTDIVDAAFTEASAAPGTALATRPAARKKIGRTKTLRPHPEGLLVDDCDRHLIDGWGVWLDGSGYPTIRYEGRDQGLHLVIAGPVAHGMQVDHINRNKLDARRANLRHVTRSLNKHNSVAYRSSKTGVLGVSPRASGKYLAQIRVDCQFVRIGLFDTVAEAAEYVRAFKIAFGVYAFPEAV